MRRFPAPLLAVVLLSACAYHSGVPSVLLVYDGSSIQLSSEEQTALRDGAEAILASCNNNSEVHKEFIPWPNNLVAEWNKQLTTGHLLIRYPESRTIDTVGGTFETRELLLPLPPGQMPAQPMTQGDRTVDYSKCSGTLMIVEFTCKQPIEGLMPASYQQYCEQFRAAK